MGIRKLVEISCDYRRCDRTYIAEGNATLIGTFHKAEAVGWVKRFTWVLCPEHADVKKILR